jgi:hypothetical protein
LVDCNGESKPMSEVLDPWQRKDFEATDQAWRRTVGLHDESCISRAYKERGRGHSKTTDLASSALWAIYSARRKIIGVAGAAAKPQAKFIRDAIDTLVRLNPWLSDDIDVKTYTITNKHTGSEFRILAANESTNYGLTPDFVIIDELTHWAKQELWTALFSAVAKRSKCVLEVIANAGFGMGTSWQWATREKARQDPRWYFNRLEGPVASWIRPEDLEEQRAILIPNAYKRLWLNLWLMNVGDALDMNRVLAACTLKGPSDFNPFEWAMGGLDMGISHDHAGFVVFGMNVLTRKLRLLVTKRWDPRQYEDGRIKFNDVEEYVRLAAKLYKIEGIAYDPWQCEHMAENLRRDAITMYAMPNSPQNAQRMATELIDAVNHDWLELYHDDNLIGDLARLNIVQRPIGAKIEAPKDENGHCDVATAFTIGLPFARSALLEYAGPA